MEWFCDGGCSGVVWFRGYDGFVVLVILILLVIMDLVVIFVDYEILKKKKLGFEFVVAAADVPPILNLGLSFITKI
jgi:hypothetical protein